ncbi:hypothetical protein TVAG_343580 [Trichomonas vaginalis G3]|uniref:Uncharacterized protein n=1 Tax=Trichomonas vaginalis (strain ATCC PRA-98 / G3) TaxID=412133 RepID=A2E1G2_TRIV3|nr:voltage-gated potassium channel protein [Trichomonas vaginalis G3]EAY13529.1 hypothetical protein TVAG_343580 [Trichomonas vaginalis G3]KAI5529206.1 voltage-gated potassium channel protein [Trichomonas vaginalis G3]|eukprot:XP_001325752.1 hypothetical protein [Trichomonas vaginalis G3]
MIEDIAIHMLGDMAAKMLLKLRKDNGAVFIDRLPIMRKSESIPMINKIDSDIIGDSIDRFDQYDRSSSTEDTTTEDGYESI